MRAFLLALPLCACTVPETTVSAIQFVSGSQMSLEFGLSASFVLGGAEPDDTPAQGMVVVLEFDPADAQSSLSTTSITLDADGRGMGVVTGGDVAESFDVLASVPTVPDTVGDRLHVLVSPRTGQLYLVTFSYAGAALFGNAELLIYEEDRECADLLPGADPPSSDVPWAVAQVLADAKGNLAPSNFVVPEGADLNYLIVRAWAFDTPEGAPVAWACVDSLPALVEDEATDLPVILSDL